MFSGGGRVIQSITSRGDLLWYRHTCGRLVEADRKHGSFKSDRTERMCIMRVNSIPDPIHSSIGPGRLLVVFPVIVLILFLFQNDIKANVRFCNKTGTTATVAIAYAEKDEPGTSTNGHRGVTVSGWWNIEPNECKVVSDIDAGNYWVYYYAHSSGGTWEGGSLLCVASRRFQTGTQFMRQNDQCPAGYRLQGFRRMATAATNHTHNLTN